MPKIIQLCANRNPNCSTSIYGLDDQGGVWRIEWKGEEETFRQIQLVPLPDAIPPEPPPLDTLALSTTYELEWLKEKSALQMEIISLRARLHRVTSVDFDSSLDKENS